MTPKVSSHKQHTTNLPLNLTALRTTLNRLPLTLTQPMGTQSQTAKPQGKPSVDPEATTQAPAQLPAKAVQEEEEIVELEEVAEGNTGGKASPSTSATPSTTRECKYDDNKDEESRRYIAQSRASAEAWKKAITETEDANVAKAAYNMLYDALYQQVLPNNPLSQLH